VLVLRHLSGECHDYGFLSYARCLIVVDTCTDVAQCLSHSRTCVQAASLPQSIVSSRTTAHEIDLLLQFADLNIVLDGTSASVGAIDGSPDRSVLLMMSQ
jgi:hypothetical protein